MTISDDELVEFTVSALPPSVTGTYSLTWDTTDLSLWIDRQKHREIFSGITFPVASGARFFIEGLAVSAQMMKDAITLNYTSNAATTVPATATLRTTVIHFSGPRDVPAFGDYVYRAEGAIPSDVNDEHSWVISGGTATHWDAKTKSITVRWDGSFGPDVGQIDYEWDGSDQHGIKVNVIVIEVPNINSFSAGTPRNGPVETAYNYQRKIVASELQPNTGASWSIPVTLHGPTVAGKPNTGINKLEVGFIQNVISFKSIGTYVDGVQRISSLNAEVTNKGPILDADDDAIVWYARGAAGTRFANATPTHATDTISANDTPSNGPPLWRLNGRKLLTHITFEEAFVVYVAAHVKNASGLEKSVFVPYASAEWQFIGDGKVLNADGYPWTTDMDPLTGASIARVVVPNGWALIHGPGAMATRGRTMNQRRESERFLPN